MRLAEIARRPEVRRARLLQPERDLRALQSDSRCVDGETAFLALAGFREDGHRFVPAAVAAGAPALFVSDEAVYDRLAQAPPAGAAGVFLVAPGRTVLADLAAAIYGDPARALRLLGVTGTSGKSTVTHLVGQLLAAVGQPCALLGTQGLRLGSEEVPSARTTPEAPDIQAFLASCRTRGVTTAMMEVTSVGIALERTRGLQFAAAAFTNLSQDHLDFHGDMAAYREAKFRLFLEYALGHAVVNLDDPAGQALAARLRTECPDLPVLPYALTQPGEAPQALHRPAVLTVANLRDDGGLLSGSLCFQGAAEPFRYSLPGRFNLSNLLAALGLLLASGETLGRLAPAIGDCTGARGRFERVPLAVPFTVIVDYAHKPGALEHVLRTARALGPGRLHVLFGCGGDRDRDKRPQMGAIAERLADRVVLSSDNPRSEDPGAILAQIAAGMARPEAVPRIGDRREAIGQLLAGARPGDVVVIAGKGDETYQELDGHTLPFDDRQVALEWGGLQDPDRS